jgi:hypothetical protein
MCARLHLVINIWQPKAGEQCPTTETRRQYLAAWNIIKARLVHSFCMATLDFLREGRDRHAPLVLVNKRARQLSGGGQTS